MKKKDRKTKKEKQRLKTYRHIESISTLLVLRSYFSIYLNSLELRQKIEQDVKGAMKRKDALRLSVLRMLLAALHNRALEKRAKSGKEEIISSEETLLVLKAEAKKRQDAIMGFSKGGRQDLAEKESSELRILGEYIPPEMSDGDMGKIVAGVIKEMGAVSTENFGRVMGEAVKRIKGQASGERILKCVKEFLPHGK